MRTTTCILILAALAGQSAAYAQENCAVVAASPRSAGEVAPLQSQAPVPVKIQADAIDFPRRNVVHLRGYTQLIRGGHRVYADELIFDKTRQEIEARGVVTFQTPAGDQIKTSVLRYDVEQNRMLSGRAEFLLASRDAEVIGATGDAVAAHGTAEQVAFDGMDIMSMKGVQLTTCLDGRDDLVFAADNLDIDLKLGLRVAKRAKVRLNMPDRHPILREILN